jgi:DNA-binding PadR family transcriptional regulator
VRLTLATVQVARALLSPAEPRQWLRDISRRAEVESGVAHPILQRMLAAEWVASWPEGHYVYYQVTKNGRREMEELLERAREDPRFKHLFQRGR